jgi:hypothetical protein
MTVNSLITINRCSLWNIEIRAAFTVSGIAHEFPYRRAGIRKTSNQYLTKQCRE